MELTPKQKRFCEEYVIELNGTQAAIKAGYSENTANEQSSRLLANVNIKEYISELQESTSKRLNITKDDMIKVTYNIVVGDDTRNGDKLKGVEIINKMLGFYDEDNRQKQPITKINLKDAISFDKP